jgi:hypothetical protein
VLDATVFVDPTRSHLADLAKDLPEAARKAIDAKTAEVQKSLIFAERFQTAKKEGAEAPKRVTEEAEAAGIKAGDLEKLGSKYKPLSTAEQGDLAKEIDGWMKQLKDAGGTDPGL